jgi:hypothetical protein
VRVVDRVCCAIVAILLSGAATAAPLNIARQGSMEAGGRIMQCATNDGGAERSARFPPGHVVIDNVYATYQYPSVQRYPYPILFNAGGGHTARFYDTTPDGREGWLTTFLREGFATYGVDRVNTGRAGADVCKINAVKLGRAPRGDLPPITRYSFESAWVNFRWGPKFGEAYPDAQFPIDFAASYYPQTVSTYRDASEEKSAAALAALIDKIDTPVILETWSSAGLIGYLAIDRPHRVKGILAVESALWSFTRLPADQLPILARIPIFIVIGDHAPELARGSRAFAAKMHELGGDVTVDVLPEAGIHGNGHTLALEKNNQEIMFRMIAWMTAHVFNHGLEPEVSASSESK